MLLEGDAGAPGGAGSAPGDAQQPLPFQPCIHGQVFLCFPVAACLHKGLVFVRQRLPGERGYHCRLKTSRNYCGRKKM